MSLFSLLQQAQGGRGISHLAARFDLNTCQADTLVATLAPAIGSAAKRRSQHGGLSHVLDALKGEGQSGYFDDARAAASVDGQEQGLDFLERLFGGRIKAKGFAHEAAKRIDIEEGIVQQFMPTLAAMIQGGLQRHMPDALIEGMRTHSSGYANGLNGGTVAIKPDLTLLTALLDADGEGSAMDDILEEFMR